MPIACWNWSNICCCIMPNWLTSGTSADSVSSDWGRLDKTAASEETTSTPEADATTGNGGGGIGSIDPPMAGRAGAAPPARSGTGRRTTSPRGRSTGNPTDASRSES